MKSAWARILSRLLVALMIWTPYQFATAGMIGTEQVAPSTSHADRDTVLGFFSRADVANRMQSMGVDPQAAKARVASMSDQEVQSLASQINSAPAGAMSDGAAVVLVILIVIGVWYLWKRM